MYFVDLQNLICKIILHGLEATLMKGCQSPILITGNKFYQRDRKIKKEKKFFDARANSYKIIM